MKLTDLPVEVRLPAHCLRAELTHTEQIVLDIQLLACSPALPLVNRHLHAVFSRTSPLYRLRYVAARHREPAGSSPGTMATVTSSRMLSQALRYPACDLACARLIEERTKKRQVVRKLPARFARVPPAGTERETRALLAHVLREYRPDVDASRDGYIFARAVQRRDTHTIRLLLCAGADPGRNDAYAVSLAIKQRDHTLLRALVERDHALLQISKEHESEEEKALLLQDDRPRYEHVKPPGALLKRAVEARQWNMVEYLRHKGALHDASDTFTNSSGHETGALPTVDLLNML